MATKTKGPRGEKSQAIRAFSQEHPEATVPEVVAELKKQGITVSQGMVYNVRSNDKKKAGAKRTKKSASAGAAGGEEHGAKTQAVKEAIRQLGRKTPAKEIKAHLDAQNTPVSLALIIKVKGRLRSRRKARRGRLAATAAGTTTARTSSAAVGNITASNLMAAKEFADKMGGVASLRKTLDVLERLR